MDNDNQRTSNTDAKKGASKFVQHDEQPQQRERLWKAESEVPYRSDSRRETSSDNFDFQPAVKEEQQRKDEKLWQGDAPDIPEEADLANKVRNDQQQYQNYLTKEDLPDATNESTGKMGSGQRQDSN
jgi:hypothetical protein